jgi:hypothetical protein
MIPVSYVDNVVLTTATITPPSMTYIDSVTQVTAQPSAVFFSYKEGQEVTLDSQMTRIIEQTVELEGRMTRAVESDDPFRINLDVATSRNITNSVELEANTSREIISYNVRLDYSTRRVVTYDIELEGNMARNCEIDLKLSSKLERSIVTDGEVPVDVIHKEYGSFVDKAKLYRVQHDVLDEDVSDNPYFNRDIANIDNSVLLTHNQTVIKAINEIFVNQRDLFYNTINAVKKFNNTIGDVVTDRRLNREYQKLGANSIIDALTKLSTNLNNVSTFVGYEFGDEGESLVSAIRAINERIDSITVEWEDIKQSDIEWIFRASQTIPELEDRVYGLLNQLTERFESFKSNVENRYVQFANEVNNNITNNYNGLLEKINGVSHRVDLLENSRRTLSRKLDTLADQIILAFRRYTAITEPEIRAILAALEHVDIEDPDEPEAISQDTYERLVGYINDKIEETDRTIAGLDNRVTELETKLDTTFTSDDLASEDDISGLFNGVTIDGAPLTTTELNNMMMTSEDVTDLFTVTLDDGTEVTITELLDMVASGADIQDLFADEGQIETMRDLLRRIAEISQEVNSEEENQG